MSACPEVDLSQIDTLVFAAGGNRCWWQAGVVSFLMAEGWRLPKQLVGTSAGAAIATACLTTGPKAALEACLQLFAANERLFAWRGLTKLKLQFAHQQIYPAWVQSFLTRDTFAAMSQASSKLRVGLTRAAPLLGMGGTVLLGTLAYLVDKHLWHSIHPRLPKLLGLRQEFVDLHSCGTVEEAQSLIIASAAAPPFMPSVCVNGSAAVDGGYTDNVPIHHQTLEEKAKTLVLLTRAYPKRPPVFRWRGRLYWQPSRRVPVSTWDCTAKATVGDAYALGESDARRSLRTLFR